MKCNHEWYQGKCVHCELTPKEAKQLDAANLRIKELEEELKQEQSAYQRCKEVSETISELWREDAARMEAKLSKYEELEKAARNTGLEDMVGDWCGGKPVVKLCYGLDNNHMKNLSELFASLNALDNEE